MSSHQPPLIYCFVGTLQISLVLAEGTAKTVMPRFLQLQSKGAFRRIHKGSFKHPADDKSLVEQSVGAGQ
jgi:hypothetical protein